MAGRGYPPKPAATRQRRNARAGIATLETPDAPVIPCLPNPDKRIWHRLTRAWWRRVWESPMAGEYLPSDVNGLGRLAILIDQFYSTLDPKLMAEIRLQEARFGLSPVDRSRLQWEIAKGDEAERRRQPRARTPDAGDDPRDALRVVS
jgi:hypothetical protein